MMEARDFLKQPLLPATGYRSIDFIAFWRSASSSDRYRIGGIWLASLALSIGLGWAATLYGWPGIPMHFGGVGFQLTVYFPLAL
ncbi:MAG: hypothetical protein K8F27_15405, partial [Sulfuricellaceae bacterium]|nr:hypothetical protein [Sulfuricellaceae bacterium]